MPRTTSRKKKEKAADFAKAKLKLGKGKAAASNATDTFFKAKGIALPSQSINVDRSAAPTTKRNLTLDDLVTQLRHYNASVRKDAILGLRELLGQHPELVDQSLGTVFNNGVRLIGDEDQAVRRALLSFFAWLLPLVAPSDLAPFNNLLLLFITSSLSHIFPEIRFDAVRFLDLLLEHIPEAVVEGWDPSAMGHGQRSEGNLEGTTSGGAEGNGQQGHGRRVMACYMSLLGISERQSQSGVSVSSNANLPPAAKLLVFNSLSTFVGLASEGTGANSRESFESSGSSSAQAGSSWFPTWLFESSFTHATDYESFRRWLSHGNPPTFSPAEGEDRPQTFAWRPTIDGSGMETSTSMLVEEEDFRGDFSAADMRRWVGRGVSLADLEGAPDKVLALLKSRTSRTGSGKAKEEMDVGSGGVLGLAHQIHPLLLSTFLDAAPSVFSPSLSDSVAATASSAAGRAAANANASSSMSAAEVNLGLVCAVGRIARTMWRAASRVRSPWATDKEHLRPLLTAMAAYFPFGADDRRRDVKSDQALRALNLAYCELVALYAIASEAQSTTTTRRKTSARGHEPDGALSVQLERVSGYVVKALRGELTSRSEPMGAQLTAEVYEGLLPTIWCLVQRQGGAGDEVVKAVVAHFSRASAGSAAKGVGFELVARLCVLQQFPSYNGAFRIRPSSPFRDDLRAWLLSLPRMLWELGSNHLEATERVLDLLLRVASGDLHAVFGPDALDALQPSLAPFFHIRHPTRGSIHGPFVRLPARLQRRALDVVFYLRPLVPALQTAVDAAVSKAREGEEAPGTTEDGDDEAARRATAFGISRHAFLAAA